LLKLNFAKNNNCVQNTISCRFIDGFLNEVRIQ
jgi:hypothetical protein